VAVKSKTKSTINTIGFQKIFAADRKTLDLFLEKDLKNTTEWWELNTYWLKTYDYSLRVQLVFDFIENLIIPSGKGKGGRFILRPFQKLFIKDIYNPTTKNMSRIVLRAILSMARKNGKSMLIAALVLVHLVGPEATMNGEIYSVANEREQAAIVFRYVAQIIRADEELHSIITIVPSTKTMVNFSNGTTYKAVSAEAGTKMGYNPTMVIFDELAQAKNTDLYDAFDTSMGARLEAGEEPLFIVISTQSKDPQQILSILIVDGLSKQDPTTVCHLYACPMAKDGEIDDCLTNEDKWLAANPALGDFRSLTEMRTFAKKAIRMPSFENTFRNLYLNQCVDQKSPLIPRAEWEGCFGEYSIAPGSELYMGLDLSGKTDLTALQGVTSGPISHTISWFWKPEATLQEHEDRDHVPYKLWNQQGYIKTTPGKSIQYSYIAQELAEISITYTIIAIAFDRYRIDDLRNAMDAIGLASYIEKKDKDGNPVIEPSGGIRLVPWGQGYKDMTPAVEAFEGAVLNRTLMHNIQPCLTWNVSNAMVVSDAAGNRKVDKSAVRFRIDGTVALCMAEGLKSRDNKGVDKKSGYEGMTKEEMIAHMTFKS
jgi:phage terminase large subunit-like protein